MSDLEERVRTEVARIITGASNFPQPMQVHMWGRDLSEPIDKLTEALIPLVREAQADLVDVLADLLDEIQNGALIAEIAAPVPGESGRQACIDTWDEITEEPAEWMRKKAAEHRGHERDHIQEMLYDAWQAGCEEAMDAAGYAPCPRDTMYDRNPYKAT